jgi:GNAT superfamily N-acetyltransferase
VSCHYDIVDWLEPDWVLDMASGRLARGSLWRRPPIVLRLYASQARHWSLFAKHHYLNAKEVLGAKCYVAEVDGAPACFVAVRPAMGHTGFRRISRIVTLPDFQGVGIGSAVLQAVAEIVLAKPGVERVTIVTGHPSMMHALQRSPHRRLDRFMKCGAPPSGNYKSLITSRGRSTAAFTFMPAATAGREPRTATVALATATVEPAPEGTPTPSTKARSRTGRRRPPPAARNRRRRPRRSTRRTEIRSLAAPPRRAATRRAVVASTVPRESPAPRDAAFARSDSRPTCRRV